MPKVLAISDMHGFLPDPKTFSEFDLLVIAGNVCPDFHQSSEQRQNHWLDTTFRDWLAHLPGEEVVGIAGNHDFVFEHPFLIPDDLLWTHLRDETFDSQLGIRIFGTPWVPKLSRWAFYGSDTALQARADSIPPCDILLSHGPPFGLTDKVVPKFGDCHVGDVTLLGAIQRIRPKYVVCGHIHEGYGIDYMEHEDRTQTKVVNASRVDENYSDNFRDPIVLDCPELS